MKIYYPQQNTNPCFLARIFSLVGARPLFYALLLAGLSGVFAPDARAQRLIVTGTNFLGVSPTITEAGGSTQYRVSFYWPRNYSPNWGSSGTRVVTISADSPEVRVSPTQLTFTPSNSRTPQVVTVTAVDDNFINSSRIRPVNLTFRSGGITGTHTRTINLFDNDVTVTVSPRTQTIDTNPDSPYAREATFGYRLDSRPTGVVEVLITPDDSDLVYLVSPAGPIRASFSPNESHRNSWRLSKGVRLRAVKGRSGRTTITLAFSGGGYDGVRVRFPVKVGPGPLVDIFDLNLVAGLTTELGTRPGEFILSSEMKGLTSLRLNDRRIANLRGLEHATRLTELELNGNNIRDLTRLTGLTSLRRLSLRNNLIADISDLVNNTGLGPGDTVDLRGNGGTLSAAAYDTQIPALQARGVNVLFDPLPTVTISPAIVAIDSSSPNAADRSATFTIALDEQPIGPVQIRSAGSNGNVFLRGNPVFDFSPSSPNAWNLPRTGTVVARHNSSGSTTFTLTFSGGGYNGVTAQVEVRVGVGVSVPDANLRAGLERLLGKNPGQVILRSELAELTSLNIRNQPITDLTGLEYATSLRDLQLPRNSLANIDLSPLSGLTSLTRLNLNGNGISDLSQLSGLTALQRLELVDNAITDVSQLRELTSLRKLFLRDNAIVDIEPLVANTGLGSGDTLDLRGNPLNRVYGTQIPVLQNRGVNVQFDLHIPDPTLRAGLERALGKNSGESILTPELAELNELDIRNQIITDLTGLEHATSLTKLLLPRNGLTDISLLSNLTALTELDLNGNRISDLAPLSGLTALRRLVLGSNAITDISPLRGLTAIQTLFIRNNRIVDITPLVANSGLSAGDVLSLRENGTLNAAAYNQHIPALRARGVEVRVDTTGITALTLSDTDLTVNEDDQTSYMVSLTSQPSGDVMVMPMSWNTNIAQVIWKLW